MEESFLEALRSFFSTYPYSDLFVLFSLAFLASTILPLGCEPFFVTLVLSKSSTPIALLTMATVGNSLGSYFTFYLGTLGKWTWLGEKKEKILKWHSKVERYGPLVGFWAWLPLLGEALTLAMGYFRTPWKSSFFWIFLGKLVRFAMILFLLPS